MLVESLARPTDREISTNPQTSERWESKSITNYTAIYGICAFYKEASAKVFKMSLT